MEVKALFDTAAILGSLMIFCARVTDVSLSTLRIIVLVRGKRYLAGLFGFVESIIYLLALSFVVGRLDNPLNIIMYGLGFASGNIVGSFIEERMAMGFITVQVISLQKPQELCCHLRETGYGVTSWEGEGREGKHCVLNITLARKKLGRLMEIIDQWDGKAFVTVLDARSTKGGFSFSYPMRQKQK